MKPRTIPLLSSAGEQALAQYKQILREQEDLIPASIRNYLSDIRHFIVWYEIQAIETDIETAVERSFDLQTIISSALKGTKQDSQRAVETIAWILRGGKWFI